MNVELEFERAGVGTKIEASLTRGEDYKSATYDGDALHLHGVDGEVFDSFPGEATAHVRGTGGGFWSKRFQGAKLFTRDPPKV
jgi:hypothetical protein